MPPRCIRAMIVAASSARVMRSQQLVFEVPDAFGHVKAGRTSIRSFSQAKSDKHQGHHGKS